MKWTILILITAILSYCKSAEVKENKSPDSIPTKEISVEPQKEDTRSKYLSQTYAAGKLIKNQTDSNSIAKARALIHEANTLLKLKKNEDSIIKYEEAFELATDPEAYYRYGNALSNIQRLEESIQAYDIAIDLGYEKVYYALYNKACSYSLLKNSEESFKYILLSVDKGYKAVPYMQEDPDLQYVRSLPEWKSKYKEIKRHAKEREEFEKMKG
jgi:tetratricopeptide (TPR) repeat protein